MKFLSFCLCSVLVLVFSSLQAQNFHLKVVDNNDFPLSGAHISYKLSGSDLYKRIVTNSKGEALINTENQEVNLEISYVGFQKIEDKISQAQTKTYQLYPKSNTLNTTIVTAQYAPTNTDNAIQKVKIIGQEKIAAMGAVNLRDVLSNEANIRISRDNILGSSMSMQGISGENVKIMIDGVPIIGRLGGNIDLEQINLNDIERIEIIEGPLSVNYGTNALAGTINLITKKDNKDKFFVKIQSHNESVGNINQNLNISGNVKDMNLRLSLGRNFFDGWHPDEIFSDMFQPIVADESRFQTWKPKTQHFARLQLSKNIKDINVAYRTELFHEDIINRGRPRAPYFENAFDDKFISHRIDQVITANGQIRKNRNLQFVAAFNHYQRRKNSYFTDLTSLERRLTDFDGDQDTTMIQAWMSRASYSTSIDRKLNYELGYDINIESSTGRRIEDNFQSIGDYAIFGSLLYRPFSWIEIKPGLRQAHNTAYNAPLIPSLNTKINIKDFVFRASYAHGFRAPAIRELYFYFVDINHNIQGNPDLKAENSSNLTVSANYKKAFNKLVGNVDFSMFRNDIDNLITLAMISGTEYSYVNIGNQKTQGANLTLSLNTNRMKLNLTGSYIGRLNEINAENVGAAYLYTPEVVANLNYLFEEIDLTLGYFYKYQGRLNNFMIDGNDNVTETFIGAFQMSDITLTKNFFKKTFSVTTGVKNLFNITNVEAMMAGTAHSAGSLNTPIGMGSIYFVSLSYQFSKKK